MALLGSVLLLLLGTSIIAEDYSNVASFWDLGMGARPLAMGGAFVGLADDGSALFFNPAGLAWSDGFSILSSGEIRPYTASYGQVSACVGNLGVGIHYFDFGEVPETDEFGNVIGAFSYRNYRVIAGTGITASDLPYISDMPLAGSIAFGLSVKLLVVNTLEAGDAVAFAVDLPFLMRVESPPFGQPYITRFAYGVLLQNVLGAPISYESGHSEDWIKKVILGGSIEVARRFIITVDLASDASIHLGLEWNPVSGLSVRSGLRRDGVWTWSLGVGTRLGGFAFDYAIVIHPHLYNQHRGSLTVSW